MTGAGTLLHDPELSSQCSSLRDELVRALAATGGRRRRLFARARAVRARAFGDQVVVRGLIEVTNLCRVNCLFCPMRRDNARQNSTYVMQEDEILDAARAIKAQGINVVFLQGGEIPQTTDIVGNAIPKLRDLFDDDVEILLCLGNKSTAEYAYLKSVGATSYILKHETSDEALHRHMRQSSFDERIACLKTLLELKYRVGTGTIVGLPGQSRESLADDVLLALRLGTHMVSASPFIPAPDTPLAECPPGDADLALNFIAAARLVSPPWLIPSVSALEKRGAGGQLAGLEAGANVVTVNFTPPDERQKYLIYGKHRYVVRLDHVKGLLAAAGLRAGRSVFL